MTKVNTIDIDIKVKQVIDIDIETSQLSWVNIDIGIDIDSLLIIDIAHVWLPGI